MRVLGNVSAVVVLVFAGSAGAITVSRTDVASEIQAALLQAGGAGINLATVTTTIVSSHTLGDGSISVGTYTNGTGTYGIGPGVIISTGDVGNYSDGPSNIDQEGISTEFFANATPGQELLLDPITGGAGNHFDATQIDITFDMDPGVNAITFDIVFGSEEFPEFFGSEFFDGFGLFVNGTNIAFVDGTPVDSNHPFMGTADGTQLNGLLGSGNTGSTDNVPMPAIGPLVHSFVADVNPTGNTLTIIIADFADDDFDSTAFISQLGGTSTGPGPGGGGAIPEPISAALGMIGLAALGAGLRRRRTA